MILPDRAVVSSGQISIAYLLTQPAIFIGFVNHFQLESLNGL